MKNEKYRDHFFKILINTQINFTANLLLHYHNYPQSSPSKN